MDTGTIGVYSLIYKASDASGNNATPVVRTIVVEDTTAPVIVRNGLAKAEVLQNTTYTDAGATASDNYDSSVVVTTKGQIDTAQAGIQVLTYTASDSSGNKAKPVTRVVVVVADAPPVITLNGEKDIFLNVGETFADPGATAQDDQDGDVSVTVLGTVNVSTPGTYILTYTASDSGGKFAVPAIRVVEVRDATPPVITLTGNSYLSIEVGETYEDAGAAATDNVDGSVAVTTSGTVDTSSPGVYVLTYTAKDAAGNSALPKTRVVLVELPKDTVPPVITLNGDEQIIITQGDTYNDLGATATDDVDGDVSVTVDGAVDSKRPWLLHPELLCF